MKRGLSGQGGDQGISIEGGCYEQITSQPGHATGELLATVPRCTPEDVEAAVDRARKAQAAWRGSSWRQREEILLRFHDLLLGRRDELLDLLQLEGGKARRHAFDEVLDAAMVSRYYARSAKSHLRPHKRRGAFPVLTATREYHHPVGVVGIISPWNYPLTLSISDAIPALAAGNAVVIKADSQTPFSALWGAALLEEAGLPADLLQVVTGSGSGWPARRPSGSSRARWSWAARTR
jgi:succinate-semialdehyde dehydrogenase/glutarate-semialdehyde dehydrogenase